MTSHTSKLEAMPLMEKDEDWEDPDDLVLGPLNSVLENMKYNSRTMSRSELWKAVVFVSTLSFVAGFTVPYIFYSLIFHQCTPDTFYTKTIDDTPNIKEDGIKLWLKKLGELNSSTLPHYIEDEWKKQGLDKVTVTSHSIVFSLPNEKKLSKLTVIKDLVDGTDPSYIKPLCCASVIDTTHPIEGDLVYANFGRLEDFIELGKLNVDVNEKIVIMKYGMVPTVNKILLAQQFGATGIILFPATRFEIKDMKIGNISCNPLLPEETTHSCPVTGQFLFRKTDVSMIPVYPVRNEDAEKLLRTLDGPNQPADWNNGDPLPYKVGPGFTDKKKIRMEIYAEDISQTTYNVIGKLNGKMETDRSIIVGSLSRRKKFTGLSVLLEISQTFARLLKKDIRPRRNILFCAWGIEDRLEGYSIDEWIRDHQENLGAEAVAYIDVDTSVAESYQLVGTPMLLKEISEAMQKVLHHKGHDVNSLKSEQINSTSLSAQLNQRLFRSSERHMQFYNILGIPSTHIQYDCKSVTPCHYVSECSNSCCDEMLSEDFHNIATIAQVWTKAIHSLSHSTILNLDITGLAAYLNNSVMNLERKYGKFVEENLLSLNDLNSSIEDFIVAAEHFQESLKNVDYKNFYFVRSTNDKLMRIGRSFIDISSSEIKLGSNLLYAPSNIIPCNAVAFPKITDLLLELTNIQNDARHKQLCKELKEEISVVATHIKSAMKIFHNDI